MSIYCDPQERKPPRVSLIANLRDHFAEFLTTILTEKITRLAAGNQHRPVVLVGLHMDADTVADVLEDVDSSAAHAVTENIAGMAVNDHLTGIHGVADIVLGIFIHDNGGAVHESSQVIARNTVNGNGDRLVDAVADKILAVDIDQINGFGPAATASRTSAVQIAVVHALCINFHVISSAGLRLRATI